MQIQIANKFPAVVALAWLHCSGPTGSAELMSTMQECRNKLLCWQYTQCLAANSSFLHKEMEAHLQGVLMDLEDPNSHHSH
jgi:hypothetical protein